MKMFGLSVLWGLSLAGCDLGEALKGEDPAGTPSVSGDAPSVEWHVGYGTLNGEHVHEGMQTSDGGYIGVGQTDDGDMSDFLVVKVSEDGEEEWQLSAGQSGAFDFGIAVAEAADGFVIGVGEVDCNARHGEVRYDLALCALRNSRRGWPFARTNINGLSLGKGNR